MGVLLPGAVRGRAYFTTLADVDLDAVEVRVLGCLIEKQRTTPDAYPLSLNGLRAACNQSTNRDPVVEYDEATIRDALHRLGRRRWTRLASGAGSRAAKYRHLLDEALGLPPAQMAVLAVLMLRGPQTPGELRQRTERLHAFRDQGELQRAVEGLVDRQLASSLGRRPGQKEERFAHRLSEDAEEPQPSRADDEAAATGSGDDRLGRLEAEVAALRAELAALRRDLGA
jgi:uncharacterized protein YceH (UPF0502 family)